MANLTITKIIDKRIGSSRFQYKCELKLVWVPVKLVENAQMTRLYKGVTRTDSSERNALGNVKEPVWSES